MDCSLQSAGSCEILDDNEIATDNDIESVSEEDSI